MRANDDGDEDGDEDVRGRTRTTERVRKRERKEKGGKRLESMHRTVYYGYCQQTRNRDEVITRHELKPSSFVMHGNREGEER